MGAPPSSNLPKGVTHMWIEPNHPIAPPGTYPENHNANQTPYLPEPPAKMPPVKNVLPKDRLVRT